MGEAPGDEAKRAIRDKKKSLKLKRTPKQQAAIRRLSAQPEAREIESDEELMGETPGDEAQRAFRRKTKLKRTPKQQAAIRRVSKRTEEAPPQSPPQAPPQAPREAPPEAPPEEPTVITVGFDTQRLDPRIQEMLTHLRPSTTATGASKELTFKRSLQKPERAQAYLDMYDAIPNLVKKTLGGPQHISDQMARLLKKYQDGLIPFDLDSPRGSGSRASGSGGPKVEDIK
jgi:hypothetical protein